MPITGRTSLALLGSVRAQGSGKDDSSVSHSHSHRGPGPPHKSARTWACTGLGAVKTKSSCTHGGVKVASLVKLI